MKILTIAVLTPTQIMVGAGFFLLGWLWAYFPVRQLLFNFFVAYPLTNRMRKLREELIAIGANRYTTVSTVVCTILSALLLFLLIRFGKTYMIVFALIGAVIAIVMLIPRLNPSNKEVFDIFCDAYYRFIPDDELRTTVFNKNPKQINARLKVMHVSGTFVPEFK
jgi:hypothetical protein